ncbi:MAG: alpha/beta fold hydrolase [Atopobiaceae bacterium]
MSPDGARIAYFVYGKPVSVGKVPILMLHGNGEEHGIFGPLIDALSADGHTIIAVDSRAQGVSTRGSLPLSYELFAEDALLVLDTLKATRAHVVGFSDGAIEALLLAKDHGTRVASVVSIGANLSPEAVVDEGGELARAQSDLNAWAAYWEGPEGAALIAAGAIDPALLTPTPRAARQTAELLHLMDVEPHIEASALSHISCPVSVVAGEFDVIDERETQLIARSIPHARLHILPGLGHSIPKEAPETLISLVRVHLGALRDTAF